MPTHCAIRFTDDDGRRRAYVFRKRHGHPEDVITNLSSLKIVVDRQQDQPPPGNVAAQFLFQDMLWYALREVALGDLDDEIRTLLYSPARTDPTDGDSYLRQHAIVDSDTHLEDVAYVYEVRLGAGNENWEVRVGQYTDVVSGPVSEVFEAASWDFSGGLEEALRRFQRSPSGSLSGP